MTAAQFKEGLAYAEDNWRNESAPHLQVDKRLIRERFELNGKSVLDFGCGMGGMSLWYATNWNCQVLGIDIDQHHIEVATHLKQKHGVGNVRFEQRDLLEQPLDEQFDLIFMNDVAEHIPLVILGKIFRQLASNLTKEGCLFVTYPPWRSPYASHLNSVIRIPWVQFLPKSWLDNMIAKHNQPLVGDLEADLRSAYDGLNRLTHSKLLKLTANAGLVEVYRKSHSFINKIKPLQEVNLRLWPFDFLVTKEFSEFKKTR